MWCHVIWCDVISCVVLCHVMQCDVMWCVLMWWASSVAKWCGAMGCDLMSLWWDVAGCDVTLCGSKWLCDVVNWKMSWWSVLQSTTPVLLCTTLYYTVLLCTTKYYSSTTLHYKVKALQSITSFDSPTHEMPSTMCEATGVTLGVHQILHLPTKNDSDGWSLPHMKRPVK